MASDIALISIRCLGHGGSMLLSEAILEGWRMCDRCHLFLCPACAQAFEQERDGMCPGSGHGDSHQMELVDIPTDEVLLFVQHEVEAPKVGPLVYEVFFRGRSREVDPLGGSLERAPERRTPRHDPLAVLRREDWKRYGAVMVKRRRGRYVTWGVVGGD
ncbi:MAG: hypothetical protein ACLF0G_13845 [Candidatus Brocadiia bacterium]